MNKKEKYINFIVDDLIKKTEIDYDQEIIKLPFLPFPLSPSYPSHLPFLHLYLLPSSTFLYYSFFKSFSEYVKERYGAHSEEINIIWNLYKDRLHSLIKK